jgi:hypothetical protein
MSLQPTTCERIFAPSHKSSRKPLHQLFYTDKGQTNNEQKESRKLIASGK